MAQRLQELCALLVEDTCGQLCSQIFTTLAENGRLSRIQIQQHTRIPTTQLRHALAVLVQQHLILHYTSDDDITFYSVDWRHSYSLTRSNRIISLVEDRYGEGAGKIIANLLQLGHARVGDLAQAFDLAASKSAGGEDDACSAHVNTESGAKVNGTDANHVRKAPDTKIHTVGQFHTTLRKLLKAGFLVKVSSRVYTPAADIQAQVEEIVKAESFPDGKVTGPKRKAEFEAACNKLKRKWRDADDFTDRDLESKGTIRRPGEPPGKRARINGGLTNGAGHGHDEENAPKLPSDMVLRVNHAQCVLAFRTDMLEQSAESYLGPVTAAVYGALLQALEGKERARDDNLQIVEEADEDEEDDLPVASTLEVSEMLDPAIDLTLGIQGVADTSQMPNGDGKGKKKGKIIDTEFADIGIKQEISDDEDEHGPNGYTSYQSRNKRIGLVEEHLKLLEEHQEVFCKRVGGGGRGEWRVHFSSLTDTLVHSTIDSTIMARFGKVHTLIVRMLRDKGRLAEKEIGALTMMRAKDVRSVLTELQYAGLVEAQEVPKDASRQPTRTLYLYFHDQKRVQSLLLQQTYQGMSRTIQRLKHERENYKNIIEKAEMMDVKQEELNQNEREAVMQWREVEEKLVIQVQRMDEQVALLRDFSGRDSSLVS